MFRDQKTGILFEMDLNLLELFEPLLLNRYCFLLYWFLKFSKEALSAYWLIRAPLSRTIFVCFLILDPDLSLGNLPNLVHDLEKLHFETVDWSD